MVLAGIDIGTNTLRLLIAETGPGLFREIHSERRITRLGERLDRTGILSADAQKRSIAALADFSGSIITYKAEKVSAVGTSALRNAANSEEFIARVNRRTGLGVRVITGEEEAKLTLLGVVTALVTAGCGAEGIDSALIVDIGGGSTEFIMTGPGGAAQSLSLPLGAVYLTERFIRHDPPIEGEAAAIRQFVREELERQPGLHRDCRGPLIGTAGTITTLAAIDRKLVAYSPDKINGYILNRESIDGMISMLCRSSLQERRQIAGLEQGREDIILAGGLIAQEIMHRFAFPEMLVSDWGLREGIVLDLYEKLRGAGRQREGTQ